MKKTSTDKVYFAKNKQKMMLIPNKRNIQISILEMNTKTLGACWISCLIFMIVGTIKLRSVHVVIELPTQAQLSEGQQHQSMAPLANSSSTSLWITGWWAVADLLNYLKLRYNGIEHRNWRWWPLFMLSTNLLEVILLHWSITWEVYQPAKWLKM